MTLNLMPYKSSQDVGFVIIDANIPRTKYEVSVHQNGTKGNDQVLTKNSDGPLVRSFIWFVLTPWISLSVFAYQILRCKKLYCVTTFIMLLSWSGRIPYTIQYGELKQLENGVYELIVKSEFECRQQTYTGPILRISFVKKNCNNVKSGGNGRLNVILMFLVVISSWIRYIFYWNYSIDDFLHLSHFVRLTSFMRDQTVCNLRKLYHSKLFVLLQ